MTKTLLLIEDSLTIQEAVTQALADHDFRIITANDSAEGLHRLQALSPDIILVDASLPDMDSLQLCRLIRETERLQHVPVVLLTSRFSGYDQATGNRVGVTGHLPKPFEAHTLRQLVQELVGDPIPKAAGTTPDTAAASPIWPTEYIEAVPPLWHTTEPPPSPSQEPTPSAPPVPTGTAPAPVSADTVDDASRLLHQSLGSNLVQLLREALDTHLHTILEKMAPHIIETVQQEVRAQVPALLETLLQQEIDKLKQAVMHDEQRQKP